MAKPEIRVAKAVHRPLREGILPSQAIRALIDAGQVKLAEPLLPNQLQPERKSTGNRTARENFMV